MRYLKQTEIAREVGEIGIAHGLALARSRAQALLVQSLSSLPNWLTSLIAIGAFVIAVASLVLRWVEYRRTDRRDVAVYLEQHFNDYDYGDPFYRVEVVNTGAVRVRVRWWYVSSGEQRVYPASDSDTDSLTGVGIDPGGHAVAGLYDDEVRHKLGEDREIRAYVTLVGERRPRRSNWHSPSGDAEPGTLTRRVRRRITTLAKRNRE